MTAKISPAAQFVKTFGKLVVSEHGTKVSVVNPTTVKLTYTDIDKYRGDSGEWDADMASVAFSQTVRGVKLIKENATGRQGSDGGFSADDEFGGWLWDLPSVKSAEMTEFKGGKVGLLVIPEKGVDPKVLDALLADKYNKYPIRVAGA